MNPSSGSCSRASSTAWESPARSAVACFATNRDSQVTATTATGGAAMTDPFIAVIHELGEELFGVQYVWMRGHVERWAATNPERVAWLEHRLLAYARRRQA